MVSLHTIPTILCRVKDHFPDSIVVLHPWRNFSFDIVKLLLFNKRFLEQNLKEASY